MAYSFDGVTLEYWGFGGDWSIFMCGFWVCNFPWFCANLIPAECFVNTKIKQQSSTRSVVNLNKQKHHRVWELQYVWSRSLCLEEREMYCKEWVRHGILQKGDTPLSRVSVLEKVPQGYLCMLLRWDLTCLWKICYCQIVASADLLAAPITVLKRQKIASILHCTMALTDWSHHVLWKMMCGLMNFWLSSAKFSLLFWNLQRKLTEAGTEKRYCFGAVSGDVVSIHQSFLYIL